MGKLCGKPVASLYLKNFMFLVWIWTPHLRALDPDPSSGLERVSVPIENDHFDVKNVEGN